MADRYVVKQTPVEAMQYDATTARGHEILAWVYRHNGSGTLDSDNLSINTLANPVPVKGNDWVVWEQGTSSGFSIYSDEDFKEKYTPLA